MSATATYADDIRLKATAAGAFIHQVRLLMAGLQYPPETDRLRLALTLFKASSDHAAAISRLLALDPLDYGVSASALFRPQVEKFLRAVFFASPEASSDDEVRDFLANDEMPLRPQTKGKPRRISLNELSTLAVDVLNGLTNTVESAKLSRMVNFAINDLNGLVHGGTVLIRLYRDGEDGVGFNASTQTFEHLIRNTTSLAAFAMALCARKLANGNAGTPPDFNSSFIHFKEVLGID